MINITEPVIQRRIEALLVMLSALFFYQQLGYSWGMFALLFFIPDLSLFAYLRGPKFGGVVYNSLHSFTWPLLLGWWGFVGGELFMEQQGQQQIQQLALIWLAHCAFDRAIGWGLKYSDSFCNTDMGVKTLAVPNKYLA